MNWFWSRSRSVRRTDFQPGGLLLDIPQRVLGREMKLVNKTLAPWVDSRGLFTEGEQQTGPSCAGHAAAEDCEAVEWGETGVKVDYKGDLVYARAKEQDGHPEAEGTTVQAAVDAAISLGYIDLQTLDRKQLFTFDEVLQGIHQFNFVIVGMMITEGYNYVDERGFIGKQKGILGGHAMVGTTYHIAEDFFGVNNRHWGRTWGLDGYARMTMAQAREQFMYGEALRWKVRSIG